MTVTADARPEKSQERTCIGCRRRDSPANLLRMVVSGGLVLPDPGHRASGRGAHLHPVTECLDLAERRKAFPRAFKVQGALDPTRVRDHVEQTCMESAAARPPAAVLTDRREDMKAGHRLMTTR